MWLRKLVSLALILACYLLSLDSLGLDCPKIEEITADLNDAKFDLNKIESGTKVKIGDTRGIIYFSPDYKTCVYEEENEKLSVWLTETKKLLFTRPENARFKGFSSDSEHIFIVLESKIARRNIVEMWRINDSKLLHSLDIPAKWECWEIDRIFLCPNSQDITIWFASTGYKDYFTAVWDFKRQDWKLQEFGYMKKEKLIFNAGRQVAAYDDNSGKIRIWDNKIKQFIASIPIGEGGKWESFSKSGKEGFIVCINKIEIWDFKNKKPQTFSIESDKIIHLIESYATKKFIVLSAKNGGKLTNNVIEILDSKNNSDGAAFPIEGKNISVGPQSTDGKKIAFQYTKDDQTETMVVNTERNTVENFKGKPLRFSYDSNYIFTTIPSDAANKAWILEDAAKKLAGVNLKEAEFDLLTVKNGAVVRIGETTGRIHFDRHRKTCVYNQEEGHLSVFDVNSKNFLYRVDPSKNFETFSNNGNMILFTYSKKESVEVLNLKGEVVIRSSISNEPGYTITFVFSPDDEKIGFDFWNDGCPYTALIFIKNLRRSDYKGYYFEGFSDDSKKFRVRAVRDSNYIELDLSEK